MDERGRGRLGGLGIILILAAAVAMAATNPSFEKHKAEIYRHARAEAAKEGFWATLRTRLGEAVDVLDAFPLEYRTYVVFSMTRHEGKIVSVGLFGSVLVLG
jgi:D-arabinose 1-dehydrogenase-like Zn-dependent alcohol dehydrogenase